MKSCWVVYVVVHVKKTPLDTPTRAPISAGRGTPDADRLFFGLLSATLSSLLLRPPSGAETNLDTLNANGDLAKHTLTVLYSLVLVLFLFHP